MEIIDAFHQVDQYNATMTQTTGTFTVTPQNVLAAAQIIQTQADSLQQKFLDERLDLRIDPPGEDDVSARIAPAWNAILLEREDSYANRIRQYVDGLHKLAQQCADSAKTYGYTEEEVAAAFGAQGG